MINRYLCIAVLGWVPVAAYAWTYPVDIRVNTLNQPHTYQHLESSGNRSLAIGKSGLAVAWEDNRSGQPQVYIAYKSSRDSRFTAARRVSVRGPAYEPAIAALADGRFVVAWEAQAHIWVRIVSKHYRGKPQLISIRRAREATINVAHGGRIWLAWSAKVGQHYQIEVAKAVQKAEQLHVLEEKPVDPKPPTQDQQYPSLAHCRDGTTVAWEDRRYGYTRILTAFAPTGKWFGPLRKLNRARHQRGKTFGNGTGAMRVVLASDGRHDLIASWLDKRDFAEGYDVYAAFSHDGGKTFGVNEKVEDVFGADHAQWHAVCAMDKQGHAVVAWDDQRNGNPDIWMSWHRPSGWSDNESPHGASGSGRQTHPALAFDRRGQLHMAFLDTAKGMSSIRYLLATPAVGEYTSSH